MGGEGFGEHLILIPLKKYDQKHTVLVSGFVATSHISHSINFTLNIRDYPPPPPPRSLKYLLSESIIIFHVFLVLPSLSLLPEQVLQFLLLALH